MAAITESSDGGSTVTAGSPFPGTQDVTSHLTKTTTEVLELQVWSVLDYPMSGAALGRCRKSVLRHFELPRGILCPGPD